MKRLGSFLQNQAKGALVRGSFLSAKDIDAPTSFFFNLGKSTGQRTTMVTSDPAMMREEVVAFYSNLFKADHCHKSSVAELLTNLPQLNPADKDTLDSEITLQEFSAAVTEMASGKSPGLDGLPAEFFKHFWNFLGRDLLDVFNESFTNGFLPASCRRAVISLFPKKGDLTLLKKLASSCVTLHRL